ncbi:TNF receptor-associated factor 5-like isoform X2 [Myxocyprinus asiaticus]|nr:TNF receptor-associated factor 5-like isoform X2 [Myxocyprinus asiaticus]XP_051550449.1 TNF receptor-associated factor 5-like isoform X2 [Myxocyprinus asiaticus]XP_051550450.1 TNF receptor-associated factor 5-like isoform X2 [Myxocyprinus asiaticus]XP_051550451.1 TNF receptor-associated factor 5-like isoform X2 [Myxocyprinus asiaticus]XP_051550452.1 TNF receptor-associated factor 5-like isoform X2 [Myxocyprinus asiaticus]XP_051550454.1 TNF receptor-associated factor 5-like isoform X2 [Myxoc
MATEENKCPGFIRQNSEPERSWELESVLTNRKLRFVAKLEQQFVCPSCSGIVLNPHQTGCGHIFCAHCIRAYIDKGGISKCPLDSISIKPEEIFQDNCCKRELLNLEVYCTNAPDCTQKVTLCNLQDHLKACQYEQLICSNSGCIEILLRKNLSEHQRNVCSFRLESCQHCRQSYTVSQLLDHQKTSCPEVEVPCSNKCQQMIKRHKLQVHADECSEVETDCIYKNYGCTVRDKRWKVLVHENTEFSSHVRLVLESNSKLEKQVEQLQQDMLIQQGALKDKSLLVNSLDRDVTLCDSTLTTLQRSVEEQRVHISSVQRELRDLRDVLGSELNEELPSLRASLDSLRQQVAVAESLREHLGVLEQTCQRHTRLLDIHVEQLQCNEQRFRQLESTSYNGKLIWKVRDYWRRKEAAAPLNSTPFYTSHSGYKLSVRAYLGGDSSGRGTHLSLYVTIMRGDFDSLLPWPFRQNITLTLLDQSGSRNHVTSAFSPDAGSDSFRRPTSDTNVATGFPRFISHSDLETPRNAVYVRDDTLFIKVKVDTTGLDDL